MRGMGLSPLARGNRHGHAFEVAPGGPIPARAGQPLQSTPERPAPTAYPRSRGATVSLLTKPVGSQGLSPLARGNRPHRAQSFSAVGPIPARAGQPCARSMPETRRRAYPRSRGATWPGHAAAGQAQGLSPLARGNLTKICAGYGTFGPIPARAGQPPFPIRLRFARTAYPRSRGATGTFGQAVCHGGGLSPLARGNRRHGDGVLPGQGPIPARAGQPRRPGRPGPARRAYPRSRGATG